MFGLCTDKQREIKQLKDRVSELEALLEGANQRYRDYIDMVDTNQTTAQFVVDFKAMNAFSIERGLDSNCVPRTVIGYFLDQESKMVKEWYLYCSLERHAELATQFQNFINTKTKEKK
jgi:hypothetical protein